MVELKLRSDMLGKFKMPDTAELVVQRWETNVLWYAANYALILLVSFVLASALSRFFIIFAIVIVFAHATLKTRSIRSKANLFRQKHMTMDKR